MHGGAGGHHPADGLVALHHPGAGRLPTLVGVEVRAAEAGRLDLDDHVAVGLEHRVGQVGAVLDAPHAAEHEAVHPAILPPAVGCRA